MSEQKTVSERLEKKNPQQNKVLTCNICDCPREVSYQEKDEETGKIRTKTHIVDCGGHFVSPYLWNRHSDYDKFKQFDVRHRKTTSGPSKPTNGE